MTTDIVTQLRQDAQAQRDAAPEGAALWVADRFDQAADEIARLRLAIARIAEQDATLSVCNGNVTVEMDDTFTDNERFALRDAINFYLNEWGAKDDLIVNDEPICRTLRGLLERFR